MRKLLCLSVLFLGACSNKAAVPPVSTGVVVTAIPSTYLYRVVDSVSRLDCMAFYRGISCVRMVP